MDASQAIPAEFRLYEPLLLEGPEYDDLEYTERMNPNSIVKKMGFVEPALADAKPLDKFQFMRVGYFCADTDTTKEAPVFNRTVGLKDSYKPAK